MSKCYVMIVLLMIFVGCGDSRSSPLESYGSEGDRCYSDGRCDTGLICMVDNICQKNIIDPCKEKVCGDHSSCKIVADVAICECDTGFIKEGVLCKQKVVEDPCESKECGENSVCGVVGIDAICSCIDRFHKEDKLCVNNLKKVDCNDITLTDPNSIQIEEQVTIEWIDGRWSTPANCNWGCNAGYTKEGGNCKKGYEDPCAGINPCSNFNRSICTDTDQNGVEECGCDPGYHLEEDSCVANQKMIICDDSALPDSSNAEMKNVEIIWDGLNWSAPAQCDWVCKSDYHNENGRCINNIKLADCTDITSLPENAYQIEQQVTIKWSNGSWGISATCLWGCDEGYLKEDGICKVGYVNPCLDNNPCTDLNRSLCTDLDTDGVAECGCDATYHLEENSCVSNNKMVDCSDSNVPDNGEAIVKQVEIIWNGVKWSDPAICNWQCKTDYTLDNGVCINKRQVDCSIDHNLPANSHNIVETVTEIYTTVNGWFTPTCIWICDDGYLLNEAKTACEEVTVPSSLIISEYLEGSSYNKAIELYNLSDQQIDLSEYSLTRATNGGGWGTPLVLSGTLNAQNTYVICHASSDQTILNKCQLIEAITNFNGDDAIGLWHNGVLIDIIGDSSEDPGSGWSVAGVINATKDHTMIRKMAIVDGNTNWSSSAGTDSSNSEWIVKGNNEFGSLGVREPPVAECSDGEILQGVCSNGTSDLECRYGSWVEIYCNCDEGYVLLGDSCIEESDPCSDVTCGNNGYCSEGSCFCSSGFHMESDICMPDQKSVLCNEVAPENATSIIEYVEITWNGSWSTPVDCNWSCDSGYHSEGDQCEERCSNGMCYIPAGTFTMGCNEVVDSNCENDEKPSHQVTLSTFKMDIYEVTAAEFRACVDAGSCSSENFTTNSIGSYYNYGNSSRDNHPMNGVNWYGATEYCQWKGKRLPTEAEWEYAARGTDGRIYPWGNETVSCDYAVMNNGDYGCGQNSTWAVGSKPSGVSPFGLYDMVGNVWEWCSDRYDENYYTSASVTNPTGPVSGSLRVLRGGSWYYDNADRLRSSDRSRDNPVFIMGQYNGFRCAKSQ